MRELAHQNNASQSTNKLTSCGANIQMPSSSVMLPVLSTLNEKELKPYWNARCKELQSYLWLPHKTVSQDPDSNSSNMQSNYQEVGSSFWMKRHVPKSLIQTNLSVSLPASATPITVNDLLADAKVIATKKIRIYPENESKYHQMLCVYRRAYNLAVEKYINDKWKDPVTNKAIDFRSEISAKIKSECEESGSVFDVNVLQAAVRSANDTFSAVCKKNKKLKGATSGFASIRFKSRKGKIHSFSTARLPKGLNVCPKSLGKAYITEEVPKEAIGKQVTITYNNGRWFMNVQQHIKLNTEIQGKVKCVAIDPGSRTFGTCYSQDEVLEVGVDFAKSVLLPMAKEMQKLFSQRTKIQNKVSGIDKDNVPQWATDQLKYIENRLMRLECRRQDKLHDLYHRFAYHLVTNYDIIFLPTFETKRMVSTKGDKRRKLNRMAVRNMLSLGHHKFKMVLRWYAKKYGKYVVDVNESYTSKTRSWDGSIVDNLGSSKTIKDNNVVMDRDINAARGIFLKHITR